MSLPNPGMSFTPLDPLPAADLNDMVENIEALADGTGLDTGAVTADKINPAGFGTVSLPAAGTTSVSITVATRSIITSYCTSRVSSGTAGNYRIIVSTGDGSILQQRTTQISQDQANRHMAATCYALVEAGTYTMTRTVSGGTFDNQSIIAMAFPAPFALA